MAYHPVDLHRYFRERCCLYLQDQTANHARKQQKAVESLACSIILVGFFFNVLPALKMEEVYFSKSL
jgi:hypothetical protein